MSQGYFLAPHDLNLRPIHEDLSGIRALLLTILQMSFYCNQSLYYTVCFLEFKEIFRFAVYVQELKRVLKLFLSLLF